MQCSLETTSMRPVAPPSPKINGVTKGDDAMSYETACKTLPGNEPAFIDMLEVRGPSMCVLDGRLDPCEWRERTCPEIEIAIPGHRATAEDLYPTSYGRSTCQTTSV